jgi:multiple sugar transport system substrate-binding protein
VITQNNRTATAAVAGLIAVGALAACSNGSAASSGGTAAGDDAAGGTYTWWDPYPQYDASSDWAKVIDKCGQAAGVTMKRTAYDTSDLTGKALLAGQQGNSPDLLLVDNPVVSTLAEAGVLTTTKDSGLSVDGFAANILAAGQSGSDTFGVPIGANTLALYYNPKVLSKAGIDPASVKDWSSLTAALEKAKAAGFKGITFSAVGTEEGSFQFLPWFWGSGAQLTDIGSPNAVAALDLWAGWVKQGLAPNSVIGNTQTTSWQEFQAGKIAFAENGTWQKADAKKNGFEVMPLPGKDGGTAPAPTGGEFLSLPVQKDTARYAVSAKIATCMTDTTNIVGTDTTLNYIAPTEVAQKEQLAADASLKPWVDAVGAAKGRTSDDLGTKYPKISEQLWTAVQSALTGKSSAQEALQQAQTAAKEATQ